MKIKKKCPKPLHWQERQDARYKENKHLGWETLNNIAVANCKEAGIEKGSYVIHIPTGRVGKVESIYCSSFAIERSEKWALVNTRDLCMEGDSNMFRPISTRRYNKTEHKLARELVDKNYEIRNLNNKNTMYREAFEKLVKEGAQPTGHTCNYGPCKKGELGLCDGECDYSGA